MKKGSLTLDEKGGKQPFVVGMLIKSTAVARECYINFRVDSESAKTQMYRRFYPKAVGNAPAGIKDLGFVPIMKQCAKGDILDVRAVDVATTQVINVVILICYGGRPKMVDISNKTLYAIDFTAATPADAGTTFSGTGIDDVASGVLKDHPVSMDIVGGYCIPEDQLANGFTFEQGFDNGVQPGLGPGEGILEYQGKAIVLATVDNFTLITTQCAVQAAAEIEAGVYAVQG